MRDLQTRFCKRSLAPLLPCLSLFLALELTSAALAREANPRLVVRQTASQSLTLIKPTDPDFEGMLDTYYPGISDQEGYQNSIRPFLVIVRNDTSELAIAYAITWTANYTDRAVRPLRATFVNRALMDPWAATYLPPGGIRLIGPMFNLTSKRYEGYHSFAQMYPASSFPSAGLSSVNVKVDGVVYEDGSFIGPDTTQIFERYVMARFAVRDEALSALNLIHSSTAPQLTVAQQLQQSLNQEMQRDGRATQRTLLALYVQARARSAQDLLDILASRHFNGLETALQNFIDRSGGNPNPSTFGRMYQTLSDQDPRVFGFTH